MRKRSGKGYRAYSITVLAIIAVVIFAIFFNGRGVFITAGMKGDVVLSAGGVNISKTAAEIFMSDEKKVYEDISSGETLSQTINGETIDEYLVNTVKGRLSRIAILNSYAKKNGIVLSSLEENNIKLAASAYIQSLSQEERASTGFKDEDVAEIFRQYTIANDTIDIITSKKTIEVSADDARVISIQYICADSEEDIKEAQTKISSGEAFSDVAAEYNGTTDTATDLKRGETDETFENVAFALKSGEISDIVQANDKYYIIKCSSDNEQSKTDANLELLKAEKKEEVFNESVLPLANSIYVDLNDGYWKNASLRSTQSLSARFDSIYEQYMGSK